MSTAYNSQTTDTIRLAGVDGYHFEGNDYTVQRKCAFVTLYREHGSIYHAARLTPVSRKTIYNWIEADEQFAEAVADSKEDSLDDLETSVYKRAFNDSLLAMFYLKAHRHKFRDKSTVDITVVQGEIAERMQSLGLKQLPGASTEFIPASMQTPVESLQSPPLPSNQQKDD